MGKASLTRRTAPAAHYVLAAAFGAIATIAVALAVGASNPRDFWLAAGIGALCAAYPSMSLGTRIFVSDHTVTRDAHGEESVELQWMRRAAAGAFLDVLVTTIIACVVLMLVGPAVEALPVLLAVVALGALDAGIRYAVIRHRALR
ncbi:MAG TPA: hypothetical protein VFY91_07240 [Microbacterium sp.]|nr:hypothetical protein [Microbacterium sp.]